jgi:thymidylate synthase (FAD)
VLPDTIGSDPEKSARFEAMLSSIYTLYSDLVDEGVPAEDARYLLPNAACTKIVVTMNARELLHFFRLRGCERAQWEIREMAIEMIKLAKSAAPIIFADTGPACVSDTCSEGKMTCGSPKEIRAKFKSL